MHKPPPPIHDLPRLQIPEKEFAALPVWQHQRYIEAIDAGEELPELPFKFQPPEGGQWLLAMRGLPTAVQIDPVSDESPLVQLERIAEELKVDATIHARRTAPAKQEPKPPKKGPRHQKPRRKRRKRRR